MNEYIDKLLTSLIKQAKPLDSSQIIYIEPSEASIAWKNKVLEAAGERK